MFQPLFITSTYVLKSKLTVYFKLLLFLNVYRHFFSHQRFPWKQYRPPLVAMIQPNTTEREMGHNSSNPNFEKKKRASLTMTEVLRDTQTVAALPLIYNSILFLLFLQNRILI